MIRPNARTDGEGDVKRKPRKRIARLRRGLFGGKDHAKCEYCGCRLTKKTATFDHVRPKSSGGYDKQKNGTLACRRCNLLKGSMAKGTFLQAMREGRITV